MTKSIDKMLVLLLSLVLCYPAIAAEEEESDVLFQITPRVWFSSLNIVNDEETSTDEIFIPFYGVTIAVNPSSTLNFLLTGFYGEGDADYINVFEGAGTTEVERLDVELLARYNFPGKKYSIFGGVRYVDFEETAIVPGTFRADDDAQIWLIETGVGMVADLSDNGRHRLFSSFTAGVSFSDWEYRDTNGFTNSGDDVLPALDFNLGYQYVIGSSLSFSARYRGFILFDENDFDHTRLNTLHGPELALTFYF